MLKPLSCLVFVANLVIITPSQAQQRVTLLDSASVNTIWSGHPVDFCMIARGDTLYAAYYANTGKYMTVSRKLPGAAWTHKTLTDANSAVGWDSHNFVTMSFDATGMLHVSGNMHNNVLRYWRSAIAGDIDSLKPVAAMIGTGGAANLENSVSYPVFVKGANGDLIFTYRTGSSGSGDQIINKWDAGTKTWSRLLSTALFSGSSTTGTRSAYLGSPTAGPVAGPDGLYHLFWFWRATADAATTHRVNYMKTGSLVSWQTSAGTGVTLPVSFDNNPGVIVDDVPQFAGLINRGQIGFDAQGRPIITYHKFDSTVAGGYTQLYNARLESGAWVVHKSTNWPYRWNFGGQGSLVIQIVFGPVTLNANGQLTQTFSHWMLGKGVLILDPVTLAATQTLPDTYWPQVLDTAYRVVNSTSTGSPLQMEVHWISVRSSTNASIVHALRWETWPENADNPRAVSPPGGALMYYRVSDPNVTALTPARLESALKKAPSLTRMQGVIRVNPTGKDPTDIRGRTEKFSVPAGDKNH